jgi:hypothetical protein
LRLLGKFLVYLGEKVELGQNLTVKLPKVETARSEKEGTRNQELFTENVEVGVIL